ncbi:MAG TPA: hypothetical protein PLR38_09485 [Syntrophorhabdaceae bacterium]|nr:hypothetical protein [Syntrophorhabdaceae bacterium]HOL06429.1 hypothetical protein [Syntrophorhabdaceae bacterium]HPP42744.1 hypothetical protein [Syntrophorhabdaceae bacterium]
MDKKIDVHNRATPPVKLYDLVKMDDPEEVLKEIKQIISFMYGDFDLETFESAFSDTVKLFEGRYPGYRPCNTEYHDLIHTMNTLLAMVRLMHGYKIKMGLLSKNMVLLGMISALFHDTGYIQKTGDKKGTGARYTLNHVERSIRFAKDYLSSKGFSQKEIQDCASMLRCTIVSIDIESIRFGSDETKIIGKMLGTADFLGQMADRTYLEKLLFLFREFMEGNIIGFKSEIDLFKKTISFYDSVRTRFKEQLDNMYHYAVYHFKVRWGINDNLYEKAIESNIQYLRNIMENYTRDYLEHLKRGNIVEQYISQKQRL